MTLESIQTVFYTFIFLTPGYFIQEMISVFMPNKSYNEGVKMIRYITYSVINCAIWSWAYWIVLLKLSSDEIIFWVIIVSLTLISSIITGTVLGLLRKLELFRKLFKYFGIQTEHSIPTAWDYKFSTTNEGKWVIVRLASGEEVYGRYSTKSLSSSEPGFRDIYIEEVYTYEDGKPWNSVDGTDGIWINASEIRSIEFRK